MDLRPISNSFDYRPLRILRDFLLDPSRCTARKLGLHNLSSSRFVLVQIGQNIVLCRTETEDFSEAEIRHVVHDLGQLYLDVSGKLQIDDFEHDVRQVVIAEECRRCPDHRTCSCCYVPAKASYFAEDERWLRKRLSGLSGHILDIGIGRGPYLDAFEAALRVGKVRLHGLDPDPKVEAFAPLLTIIRKGIEDFEPEEGLYDHVLAIRSLHHVADLDGAFARISKALRPRGTLLMIESAALPLVRSRRHSEASHLYAKGGFQHYRNWDSYEMLAFLDSRFPFEVTYHRPIGPDTTDQWILEMARLP